MWEPVLHIINNEPSIDFLIVITAILCNLLLEFSPSKVHLLNSGIVEKLVQLYDYEDSSLKLNCIWALMNMTYQCEDKIKTVIMNTFGLNRILKNINETDSLLLLRTLGLLRNLLYNSNHIELIMTKYSTELLGSLCLVLKNNTSSEIKEQVLCTLGNIASTSQYDYITSNSDIMSTLCELLVSFFYLTFHFFFHFYFLRTNVCYVSYHSCKLLDYT